ncbi:MAG TPA: 16S rRNA (uracil(1498)-N(3))-methyltransferase [Ohtaekwangia sp.]
MNLFYQPQLSDGIFFLDAEESRHCVKVLRNKPGDSINITDGKGSFYTATITEADPHQCTFRIVDTKKEIRKAYSIHIAISPTKNADRIEWFVEKSVELGVDEITLLNCEHTERTFIKTERLQKVAVSAMKQSLKTTLPLIHGVQKFTDVVRNTKASSKFIGFVDDGNPHHLKDVASPASEYILLIGPEGDFSSVELSLALESGFQKVSLGSSRLRTETAGIAGCHILNLVNTK